MSSQPRPRRVEVEAMDDVTIATFIDRRILAEENIRILSELLLELVDKSRAKKMLLDFRNVKYMSSAVLGMLITLNKKVQAAGGQLVLCNIDLNIREVFELTKLDKLFVIRGGEQEALQAF